MSQGVPYSAKQQDLYYPAKSLDGFPSQRPRTDAELCAWMSLLAYCDQGTSFAFDETTIEKKLSPLGFNRLAFFESPVAPKQGGTHCFLAIHEDVVREKKLAVVAFRGTDKDDPTDFLDDVEAVLVDWKGRGKVFGGFKKALEEVEPQLGLLKALDSIDYKLLFTGHSLGAALATLLASLRAPSALYTIGSPRVGDHDFVTSLNSVKSIRFVDCCDIVTQLPPPLLGYGHLGDPIYIDRSRHVTPSPSDDYVSVDRLRARADYLLQYAWKSGMVAVRDLADHAPINYVTAIASVQL